MWSPGSTAVRLGGRLCCGNRLWMGWQGDAVNGAHRRLLAGDGGGERGAGLPGYPICPPSRRRCSIQVAPIFGSRQETGGALLGQANPPIHGRGFGRRKLSGTIASTASRSDPGTQVAQGPWLPLRTFRERYVGQRCTSARTACMPTFTQGSAAPPTAPAPSSSTFTEVGFPFPNASFDSEQR